MYTQSPSVNHQNCIRNLQNGVTLVIKGWMFGFKQGGKTPFVFVHHFSYMFKDRLTEFTAAKNNMIKGQVELQKNCFVQCCLNMAECTSMYSCSEHRH